MPINLYSLFLTHAQTYAQSEPIRRVLDSLSDAVAAARATVEHARTDFVAEHYEAVCDDESDVLENLVGTAFVAVQTQIAGVSSILMRLHKYAARNGVALATTDGEKNSIIQAGGIMLAGTTHSKIAVINACANYFKHHDEWSRPWSNLDRRSRRTASIIETIGGNEGGSGNLRTGLEALGIDYDLLDLLQEEVSKWAQSVIGAYRKELESIGVL